jgi:FkbM family methyltransferase
MAFHVVTTDRALYRICSRGVPKVQTVLDVGASDSRWSYMCMKYFPSASYLLVEANKVHSDKLNAFCAKHQNALRVIAAAGNRDGECIFDASDPFGGAVDTDAKSDDINICTIPMISLDNEVKRNNLNGPFFFFFYTHGFELNILEGAKNILKEASLVVIEAYIFKLHSKSPLFYELCAYMDNIGFFPIDFSEPMWRPKDKALWQLDFFFVKKEDNVFSSNSYL